LTACCKPCSLTTLRLHVNIAFPTGLAILLRHRSLLSLSVLAAACAVGGEPRTTGLTYYEGAEPASLDPALSNDVQSGEVVALLFDNLVQFDTDGRLQPGLARRWEMDSSGTVYSFHLRHGATFHDGQPIGAREVRASILRALDPAIKAGRQWPLFPIKGAREFAAGKAASIPGISVPNDSTIVFTLTAPLNTFPEFLAMPVAAVAPSPAPGGFDQAPVGSGPWRFVSWSHDDAIVLARNPTYWAGPPAEDTLTVRIVPEVLTQGAEYETGNLSVVEIPFGETRRWEQARPEELQRRPAIRDLYVAMNTTRGPLRDVRVRRALNLATDVTTLLRTQMAGRGVRAACWWRPGTRRDSSSSSGAARARNSHASRSRSSRIWRRSASGSRSSSATHPASGPRCGMARPISSWATGTPTIPTPRTSRTRSSTRATRAWEATMPSCPIARSTR
jgi:ABC-type transport system substrate-binding protein